MYACALLITCKLTTAVIWQTLSTDSFSLKTGEPALSSGELQVTLDGHDAVN